MPKFTKIERLRNQMEFRAVFEHGRKISSGMFVLVYVSSDKRRFGLVVSSRVGNACTRNRIKRVLREFFRLNKGIFPNGDCVIIARPGIGAMDNGKLRVGLEKLIRKIS